MATTQNNEKCSFPDGVEVKYGPFDIDPCRYAVIEKHQSCTVEVLKCVKCGHITIDWHINEEIPGDFVEDLGDHKCQKD